MRPGVRAYRTLLWLYPPAFRHEYGDHMVAVFEDMLRDGAAGRVWWRVVVDAATSVPIQHTEAVMATRISPNIVGLLSVLFFAVALSGFFMGDFANFWLGIPLGFVALGASAASAMYWKSHWQYVEARALHHRWYWFLGGGVLLEAAIAVGDRTDLSVPWAFIIGIFMIGWALMIVGAVLGIWNGFAALRRRGENGAWPAS